MGRYDRNILVKGFGEEGQAKLRKSKVLIIGAGGLGSPVLYYLTAAGVGTLGIMDYDKIDITNLQRQIIHFTNDLNRDKVISAKEKLQLLNPEVNIITYNEKLSEANSNIINNYDFVVECCDSYEAKYLINDICVKNKKAFSHGSALAMQGEAMTYVPESACYRCIFDNPPDVKNPEVLLPIQAGIIGTIAGVIGSIQATETIKYLTGVGELLINKILIFDGRNMNFYTIKANQDCNCLCRYNR
jgi:molybdopterin/thiamine biosynthesis adenylyltransferase